MEPGRCDRGRLLLANRQSRRAVLRTGGAGPAAADRPPAAATRPATAHTQDATPAPHPTGVAPLLLTGARLAARGFELTTFVSPNVPGVEKDHNLRVFDEYARRWYERGPDPVVE